MATPAPWKASRGTKDCPAILAVTASSASGSRMAARVVASRSPSTCRPPSGAVRARSSARMNGPSRSGRTISTIRSPSRPAGFAVAAHGRITSIGSSSNNDTNGTGRDARRSARTRRGIGSSQRSSSVAISPLMVVPAGGSIGRMKRRVRPGWTRPIPTDEANSLARNSRLQPSGVVRRMRSWLR